MTQNASDVEIANRGFAAGKDLNDVLEDITTLHSGTGCTVHDIRKPMVV